MTRHWWMTGLVALLLSVSCASGPEGAAGEERVIGGALMVFVPKGEFLMGSSDVDKHAESDEKPQHTVYLDSFWIDKFKVTNAQYQKCVGAGKCTAPRQSKSYTRSFYYADSKYDNYPVINVVVNDAKSFCEWAGKRLPTEAQWEKAARGTDERIYPWGNVFDKNLLNSYEGGRGDTSEVGGYPLSASSYGVMDMAGNVAEWVADWYDSGYYKNSPSRNPSGPSSGLDRVQRGGSWNNAAADVRAANRFNSRFSSNFVGFRCVE